MGRDARNNENSQEGKALVFTPACDMMGTRLAIGDLVVLQPGPQFQPIYQLVECKPDLRPGAPNGAHLLMLVSECPMGVLPNGIVPGLRVAVRRDDPKEPSKAEEPPSLIVLPGGADVPSSKRETPHG